MLNETQVRDLARTVRNMYDRRDSRGRDLEGGWFPVNIDEIVDEVRGPRSPLSKGWEARLTPITVSYQERWAQLANTLLAHLNASLRTSSFRVLTRRHDDPVTMYVEYAITADELARVTGADIARMGGLEDGSDSVKPTLLCLDDDGTVKAAIVIDLVYAAVTGAFLDVRGPDLVLCLKANL